ncbi:MAG: type IV pili methyl-accepting chemotaxis transducer N-terminal domain-containing protein [Methylobacillus sp.]|jgi:two-component system nitrate/nitrite sensor histidine kinase NarX|nr:type IV pili methyl-accepting chemotaxis transducer N-terminal domain-containing protein [Methylobacillus sp.]
MKLKISQKITSLLVFYFLVAVVAIGSTLVVSRQLEGSAAAINDAGKERMRSYRIAFLMAQQVRQPELNLREEIAGEALRFERTLIELKNGNPQRPLFLPKEPRVIEQVEALQSAWRDVMRPRIEAILGSTSAGEQSRLLAEYQISLESFVAGIDGLVVLIERSNARATGILRPFQVGLIVVALLGTVLLDYIFSLLLVRPVQRLNDGLRSMGEGNFGVRLPAKGEDELSELARGFNQMAEQLQDTYDTLEQRIAEKTQRVEVKNRELGALYEVAAFLNASTAAEPLCDNVLARMIALFNASGGVIRLTDPKGEQLKVVAARGVSEDFLARETWLDVGSCVCGAVARDGVAVSSDLASPASQTMDACNCDDFHSIAAIPIRSKQNMLGLLNLFFDTPRILPPAEVRLLESVGLHLGTAIENQRLVAREKEMAISEERNLLAQELHDSIAQSLAFLNIQVQLLQEDLGNRKVANAIEVVGQIREGVQESYDDVRELLVHFRTRLDHANLDAAIVSALEKFEGQVGISAHYSRIGAPLDLPPESVLQILHILQESLSNIRKHSEATNVEVELISANECRLTVKDNGKGYDPDKSAGDTHVGIRIMRERAHRMGGSLALVSAPGRGTEVSLTWAAATMTTGDA